jgi:hypothetical protein
MLVGSQAPPTASGLDNNSAKTIVKKLKIAAMVFLVPVLSCDKTNPTEATLSGTFQYRACDSTATLILQGWMTLVAQDSTHVWGKWHLVKVGNPQDIGPQSGDGDLIAAFDGGLFSVNLNPAWKDNNVFLTGEYAGKTYSGRWYWSGYPGILNYGTFQALKE